MTQEMQGAFTRDFQALARRHPDQVICVDRDGTEYSYSDFLDLTERCLAWLQAKHLAPGDTVACLLPNSMDTVVLFFACLFGGYRFAPLHCTATVFEVKGFAQLATPRCLFVGDPVTAATFNGLVELGLAPERLDLRREIEKVSADSVATRPGGGSLIILTSGSTGTEKAVLLDGDVLWSAGFAYLSAHGLAQSRLRFWNYLPMSYLGGLFNLCLIPVASGGSFVIGDPFTGNTFLGFWAYVARHGIDSIWLVPSIVRGLLAFGERSKVAVRPSLRVCFLGTAPIDSAEKQRFTDMFGIRPIESYGLTETTFVTSEGVTPGSAPGPAENVGQILDYVDVETRSVQDLEGGEPDEAARRQEIWVRSPYLARGYLTARDGFVPLPRDDAGFFPTGDLGYVQDGCLVLTGRLRNIVKKGGYMIALEEAEVLMRTHPAVREAVAAPIDHRFYGESYVVAVTLREDAGAVGEPELEAWLQEKLARHKWPESVLRVTDLPRTRSGKYDRNALKERIRPAS